MPLVVVPWLRGPLDCDLEEVDLPPEPPPPKRRLPCGGCGRPAQVGFAVVEWFCSDRCYDRYLAALGLEDVRVDADR